MRSNQGRALRPRLEIAEAWAVLAILLLGFTLRVYRLGDQNIWWDEGFSILLARMDWADATLRTAADVHPPLYYWHLWPWIRLAGDSEFAARFLSAMWGVLTVAVVYAFGKRLGGRRVGLLGALLVAVSRFHVWWSQELRMYSLATLAATLTLYAAARWFDEQRERGALAWLGAYVVGATASLYSLYMAGLAPLVANCYALVALGRIPAGRRRQALAHWLVAQAVALLLFLPWLALALPRMQSWSRTEPFSFRLLLKLYGTVLGLGVSTDIERHLIYLLPFAVVVAGGLATLLWRRGPEARGIPGVQAAYLLLAALAAMPVAVYLITRPRGLFHTPRVEARYLVLFAPAFYLLLAWSVVRLARRSRAVGLAAAATSLGLMLAFLPGYYAGRYLRDEMQTMARILGAYAQPNDVILLISGNRYQTFGYYYERLVPPERRARVLQLPQGDEFTAGNVGPQLEAATAGHERFWVAAVEAGIQDPSGLSLPWLDTHFPRALTHQVGYNALILYAEGEAPFLAPRDALVPEHPLQEGGGGLEVLGYDLPGHEYLAGDAVDLGLYLAAEKPLQAEVQWLRDDGELLQSTTQEWPAMAGEATRAAIRFQAWPWYRGGGTYFLLRWPAGEEPALTLRLPGPRILPLPDRPRPEKIAQPLDIQLGQGIRLRGYDLHRQVRGGQATAQPGEAMVLDLFWEATEPLGEDYTVFTQLVGSAHNPKTGSPLWGQHDGPPVSGEYATSAWTPGQLIADRHALEIDPEAPAGEYELVVGLYLPATLERVPVLGADGSPAGDHVVLARIAVP